MLKIPRFAVMGAPIAHSLSPLIHYTFAKQTGIRLRYDKLYVERKNFDREVYSFFALGGVGLNITSPLKELAYELSDIQTERCQMVKSANTLWFKNGKIYADNTDGEGFISDLQSFINLSNKKILIIGAGGAARGIIPVILSLQPKSIAILNRTRANVDKLIYDFGEKLTIASKDESYAVIINASASDGEICSDDLIKKSNFCYDLRYVYAGSTPFQARANHIGVKAANGLGMLKNQAALSFAVWHGVNP